MRIVLILFGLIFIVSCSQNKDRRFKYKGNLFKMLWRNDNLDPVSSSVLIKDKTIYYGSFNDSFYAVDLLNGKIKMSFKTGDDVYFKPVIDKDKIFFSSFDLFIYCIDTTGKLIWKKKTEGRIKNNLIEDSNSIIASIRGNGLFKIDKTTGQTIWHLKQVPMSFTTSQPIIYKKIIYVGNFDVEKLDSKLIAVNKETGKIIWEKDQSGFVSADPQLAPNGLVFGLDKYYEGGYIKMLDYNTGEEIWSTPIDIETHYRPFVDNSNVIVCTYNYNRIVCLDNKNGKVKWTLHLTKDESILTHVEAYKEQIYFSTSKKYNINFKHYCVDINTGKVVFSEIFYWITPIVANNTIYFPSGGDLWMLK